MIERHEAERLAAAINNLRPDWPIPSLLTFIHKRQHRPLLDLTIHLAWVAQLPETSTPARADQDGPWQHATTPRPGTTSASAHITTAADTDCAICGQGEPAHAHVTTYGDHPYVSRHDHARMVQERYDAARQELADNPTTLNPYATERTTP